MQTDILIAGGGLAGLTAALHLQRAGLDVLVIEKNGYPQQKVCGEYISNEVLPYLHWLEADPSVLAPAEIKRLRFTDRSQKSITTKLPMGGFGVSRFSLDNFLYQKFVAKGGIVIHDSVISIKSAEFFTIETRSGKVINAKKVIGAYGKRSGLDLQLNRSFIEKRSPYLAVKAHYAGSFEEDLVGLYTYQGGYCGVSTIENGKLNICYLADYNSFKQHKSIEAYQEKVMYQNAALKQIFENSKCLFDQPMTVSQLSFGSRPAVENHILMAGDTAGLIHPLCGNGMSMAIHSAKICAELLIDWFETQQSTVAFEKNYMAMWKNEFKSRLKMGSLLSAVLRKESLSDLVMRGLICMPGLLPIIIKKTHGKTLTTQV